MFSNFNGDEVRLSYTRIESAILSKVDIEKAASTSNMYGSEYFLIKYISEVV